MSAAISLSGAQVERRRATVSAPTLVGPIAFVGGAVALVGVSLPWLSFYAGLHVITGLDGAFGSAAAVLAAVGMASALAFAVSRGQAARWAVGLAGFGVMSIAGWSGLNALATVAGTVDPLLIVAPGPGTLVLAVGGALMVATMFLPDGPTDGARTVAPASLRTALTVSLVAGGIIHLGVGQDHLAESTLVGTAIILAGIAQIAVAAVMRMKPSMRPVLAAALGLSAILVVAYAAAVTVGLPVEAHGHETLVTGHGSGAHVEAVSPIGLFTVGVQALAVSIAATLLARGR